MPLFRGIVQEKTIASCHSRPWRFAHVHPSHGPAVAHVGALCRRAAHLVIALPVAYQIACGEPSPAAGLRVRIAGGPEHHLPFDRQDCQTFRAPYAALAGAMAGRLVAVLARYPEALVLAAHLQPTATAAALLRRAAGAETILPEAPP